CRTMADCVLNTSAEARHPPYTAHTQTVGGTRPMKALRKFWLAATLLLAASVACAGDYQETIDLFRHAGQSAWFFNHCYGYAVFPTIGKGAFVVGGAHGTGRVYEHGRYVGDTSLTQVSVGFQAGGEGYSQIVFFEDKRAFDEFTKGN